MRQRMEDARTRNDADYDLPFTFRPNDKIADLKARFEGWFKSWTKLKGQNVIATFEHRGEVMKDLYQTWLKTAHKEIAMYRDTPLKDMMGMPGTGDAANQCAPHMVNTL